MIRLLVAPESVEVTPGVPVAFVITVVNDGAATETATLRLVGLDPQWVAGIEEPTFVVAAGARVEVPVSVTLPPGFPSGAQLIGVEARVEGARRPSLASMQLVVASVDGVSMGLSPASFRGGWRGRFRINLINRGREPITLTLSGRPAGPPATDAKKAELQFTFKPEEITLRPGERARAKGTVSGKRPTVGAIRTRPMTVVAQGHSAPIHADGRFSQRPLLSRRVLRVFALFIVLSMWAGALVTAVRFSQDRRTETAADASAEVTPGEEGADGGATPGEEGGEDGGEGVTPGEEGGEEGEAPPGATISGQVEGLSDRSNVQVDLRPVTLADALPPEDEDVELISAAKDGREGKLSAQALGVEPEGPVAPTSSTVTDAEGFWAFAGLESPANYELTFSKAGFGVRTYVVSVDDENTNVPLAVTMAAGDGELAGTVSTEDGPLGGATVTVTDGTVTYTTTTPTAGAIGHWSVGGLATPATYLITATRRGFGTETLQVTLGGSESRDGIEQTLVAGVGSIAGTITGGGDGVGGITVTAANEEISRSVTTLTEDPIGSYALPQLPIPGTYTLTVTGDGWVPQTQLVELTDNTDGIDFELLSTTASVSGVVEGPDGALSAVGVTVAQDEPLVKTLTAVDPVGTYEVSGLAPGTYTVTFERFGYATETSIVELAAGDVEQVDIFLQETPEEELTGNATVHGIVRDSTTGDPIEDVDVELGESTATSDANGSFVLEDLPAGTGEIALEHSRHQAMTRSVSLGVAADVTVDITMLPLAGLQGQVTDLTATPLEGVEVSVVAQDGTDDVDVEPATTDENGEYLIEQSFPSGSYTATFSLDDFGEQTRDFDATAGSNAVADITLVELGTIAGSIQEPATGTSGGFTPVANAQITITRTDTTPDEVVFGPTVDADGTFTKSGLQPGDYLVEAKGTSPSTATFSKTIDDLDLREVRDGGVVLVPGASDVNGQVYYLDASNNRVAISGATIETRVVTGFETLPVFPFINPILSTKSATTDSNGDYTITGAVAGSVAGYTVTKSGFITRTVAITSSTNSDEGDIVLTPSPRTVSGQAILNGAASGTVTATLTSSGLASSKTTTFAATNVLGTTGTYTFSDLQPGSYTVTFTLTGYHNATKTFTIDPGPSATTIQIPNTPSAPTLIKKSGIHVDVRENTTGGTQLTDAIVSLTIPTDPSFTTRVPTANTSSPVGIYEFNDLQAATYRLTISKSTYQTVTEDITLTVGDLRTAAGTGVLVRALPKFTTATIHLKSNDNGTSTALEDAVVTVAPSTGGALLTLVESSTVPGDYALTGLVTDTYTFTASKALHETKSVDFSATVGTDLTQTITLDRYSDLTITVYSDPTDTGGADSTTLDTGTESLLSGATVTATPSTGGATLTLSGVSGSPGLYRTEDIPPGTYNVTIAASNHVSRTVSRSPVAGLASTGNGAVVELLKYPTMTVEVFSDDDFTSGDTTDDAPINDDTSSSTDGATVTATLSSGSGSTLTLTAPDDTNDYSVSNVPPGTYTITVTSTDHATRTITGVVVDAAVAESVSTFLLKNPPLIVMVTDDTNATLTGATVRATLAGNTVELTDQGGGLYRAAALAPGTHSITASKTGFGQGSTTFAITAGTRPSFVAGSPSNGTANLVVALEQDATIQVNVTDDTGGAALNDVEVSLRVLDDSTFATRHRFTGELAGSTDDGRATFTGLSASKAYQLRVSRAGYDIEVVDVGDIDDEANDDFVPGETEVVNVALTRLSALIVNLQSNPGATALAGGTVVATPNAGGSGVTLSPTGTTGVYLAPALPYGGTWTISGSATGHSSNTTTVSITVGTNATTTLGLSKYPTVSVQVNDDDGAPVTAVTDATVTLTPTAGPAVAVAHAGTGSYTRALTDPGTYTLTVSKTGWATSTQTITATAGVTFSTVTVGLQPLRDLTITVFSDSIDTTTAGHTGTELGGVTGVLTDADGNPVRTESSDDDGDLVFEDLAPGVTYGVELSKDRWVTKSQSVSVANADGGLVHVILTSYPDIIATVRSNDGTPAALAGATVVATPEGGGAGVPLTATTTTGRYVAANVLPGDYTVTASAPAHVSTTTSSFTVDFTGDENLGNIDLDAYPTLQVTVMSNDLTTGTTADDDAITSATVTATPSNGGPVVGLVHTGSGVYEAVGVAPSTTYSVAVSDAAHESGTGSVAGTVGGVRTTTVTLLELPLVAVQVDEDDGSVAAITNATVTITPTAGGTALALTHNATGEYRRSSVPAGTYTLSVSKSGWVTHTETVTVTAGTAFTIVDVDLLPQRTVTIEVFADVITNPGTEVTGAVVELLNSSGVAVESHTTTSNGQAEFTGLTPGTLYTFRISGSGYVTETLSLTPVNTADTTRNEAITSYPDLTVTVRSADGSTAAFAGATVLATPSDGGPAVAVLPTSTTGTYKAENIEPGDDYIVSASAPLHESASVSDVDIVLGTDESVGPIDLAAYPTLRVTVLSNDLTTGTTADDDLLTSATVTATPSGGGPVVSLAHTGSGVYEAASVLPSTTYAVTVTDASHATGTGSVSGVAGDIRTTSITVLELPTLTVQVNTDNGTVVAGTTGATVTLAPTDGSAALSVSHAGSPNGKYVRGSIPAGTYTLSASLSGHETASTSVTVTAGTAISGDPFTLELDKLGSFQVEVFDEVIDTTALESGVRVALTVPADPTFPERIITTGSDGYALFSDLEPGLTYMVTISKDGFDTATVTEAIGVGEAFTNQTALQRVSTLTVELYTENDADVGTDGTLSGATVTATLAGGSALPLSQVSAGVYRLSPVPAGSYTINASATDHSSGSTTTTVGVGDDEVVSLTLLAHPVLSLTVRSSVTINSIATYSALTNATVTATLTVAPGTTYTFTHQGEGVYTRAIPVNGTYDISVSAPGHTTITVAHNDIATVIGDAAPSLSTTDLTAETGSVSGTIDVLGTTDEGVVVTASLNGATIAATPATTIAGGAWSISGLAPGTWQITFTRDLYSPLTVPVLIARGSSADSGSSLTGLNRTLAPLGTSIIGQVSSVASGQLAVSSTNPSTPLSGVTVSIAPGAGGDTRGDQTVVDDGNGHYYFTFADLAPATYTLTFSKANHTNLVLAVTVTAGQIVELAPTLTQTPRQVNFAATESAAGLDGVVFRLTNSSLLSSPGYVEATTAGGVAAISLSNVPPGTYTLTVTAPTGHAITSTPPSSVTVSTANVTVPDQTFQATSSVTGIVVQNNDSAAGSSGNDGFPNPGATVTVTKGSFSASTTSNTTDGTFTVSNVPQASGYTVTISATGYATTTLSSQTVGSSALNVGTVTIDQLSSIAVSIIDQGGNAVSASTIGIYDADGTTRTATYAGTTTSDATNASSTTFSSLTPGETVFVRATAAGRTQVLEVSRTLEAGANSGTEALVVELPSSATLNVTVAGLIAGESVTLTFEWEAPTGMSTGSSKLFSVDGGTLNQSVTVPPGVPVYVIRPDVGAKNGSVTTPVTGSPITTAAGATTAVTVTYA